MTKLVRGASAVLAGCALALAFAAPARADAVRDSEWHVGFLHLAEAQRISQGDGVTVAVIDTGVDATHPDLQGNVLPGIDAWSPARDGHTDQRGHGTAMASLIAGHGHGDGGRDGILGVAPKAKILPVAVFPPGSTDAQPQYPPADLAAGIRWAADQGVQIINMSLGGSSDRRVQDAVNYAASKGVVMVAAAGNLPDANEVNYPAAYEPVIAVSGIDRTGEFGSFSVSGRGVDLAAPGADIPGAIPGSGYFTASGTSNSTAIVSGVLALLKSKYPTLSPDQLFQRLKATAIDKGPAGYDNQYGWGVIDPLAALTRDFGDTSSAPPSGSASSAAKAVAPAGSNTQPATGSTATNPAVLAAVVTAAAIALVAVVITLVWLARRRRPSLSSGAPPS